MPLYARAFDALALLVDGAGALVSKETMLQQLWPGVLVEENSVARVMSDLRKALREQAACVATVPRRGYRLDAEVRAARRARQPEVEGRRTLAVLPLASLSGEAADRLLGFGLADGLITRLSQLRSLLVRPTSAVARYVDAPAPAAVGRELNAEIVLCGGVRRSGGQVRVSLQLVDVASEATIWAARFDEAEAAIFALKDSLSARAADALALELTRSEREQLARRPTQDADAHDLYVRGRLCLSQRVGDSIQQAAECFRRAVERDPGFALAHAGLAEAYTLLSVASATLDPLPPRVMAPLAKAAAQQALELDEQLSEVHGILGHIGYCYDWDLAGAEAAIGRALELNPSNAGARQYHALGLSSVGRHDEALEQMRLARLLDPTNMVMNANLGFILYRARRYAAAVEQLRRTVAIDPDSAYARFRFGLAAEAAGLTDEALAQYEAVLAMPMADVHGLVGKGHLLARLGREREVREILDRLREIAETRYVSAYYFAEIHAGLGETGAAFEWLERAYAERPVMMISLRANPKFDGLREDPRFHDLERRVGIWKNS